MNEIRPNRPAEKSPVRFDDEIDLIDLTITLWRRKWIVAGVFLLVFLAALAFAYLQGGDEQENVRISSLYEIPSIVFSGGEQQRIQYAYEPKALSEVVSRVYIPQLAREGGDVTIDVEIPKDTNLLALSSNLPAGDESRVEGGVSAHEALLKRIESAIETRVDALIEGPNSGHVMVLGGGVVESAQLDEASVGSGPSAALVIALGAILGLFAGLFAALMVGFVAAAHERLHETEATED